jgi:uncharacterized protein YegL
MADEVHYCACNRASFIILKLSRPSVVGELKEKESARNAYDDAIASGHGAYLLEQKEENKFVANIGNLPPGKEVLVSVVYVLELEFNDEGQLRLELLEQGYSPDGENSLTFPDPTSSDALQLSNRVPNGLTIDIELDMSSKITQVVTPTHASMTKIVLDPTNPRRGHVSIPTTKTPLVQNFELFIQLDSGNELVTRVQKNSKGERIAMVAFQPHLNDVEPLGEIIFLLDRSGSMMGPRLNRAKEAIQIFLRSLTSGVKFNIISFGTSFVQLFPESKDYNSETLAAAAAAVKSMSANMGGTEILAPLQAIFKKAPEPKYPRQLFILTDGEVKNAQDCINACRAGADTTRTFCFGIGTGASKELVEGMARAGNGSAVLIGNNDRIDDKVLEQLGDALLPAVTNISVNWSGAAAKVSPSRYGPAFGGKQVVSFAWIKPELSESDVLPVRFMATTPIQDFDITRQVSLKEVNDGTFLFALAARRLFDEFQRGVSFAHDPVTGKLKADWDEEKVKQAMISLSLETGVMCKHTAFVAIEERTDPTQGNMLLREVLKTKTGTVTTKNNRGGMYGVQLAPGDESDGSWGSDEDDFGGPSLVRASSATLRKSSSGSVPMSAGGFGLSAVLQSSRMSLADLGSDDDEDWEDEEDEKQSKKGKAKLSQEKSHSMKPGSAPSKSGAAGALPPARPSSNAASGAEKSTTALPEATLTKMREVILKQTAEGSWTIADAGSLINSVDNIKKALSAIAGAPSSAADLVFATAVVCAYFEKKLAAEKKIWQLVVKKARGWIAKQNLTSVDWNAKAAEFVASL